MQSNCIPAHHFPRIIMNLNLNLKRCSLSMKQISRMITNSTRSRSTGTTIYKQTPCRMLHSTTPHYLSTPASESSPQVEQIFQKIIQLDTIEVHLLTELVNEKLGFQKLTPAQREAAARGMNNKGGKGSTTTEGEAKEEAKTIFDLKLTGFDDKAKIKVIKEIRAITGLGLKEAKEMVEGVPKVVKKDIKMEEAEEIKAKLEAVGATIEIS
jgi:large subunit ribosomal protein L7/L12